MEVRVNLDKVISRSTRLKLVLKNNQHLKFVSLEVSQKGGNFKILILLHF